MAFRDSDQAPQFTKARLARLPDKAKTQLDIWLEEPERHEQVAVGEETQGAVKKIEEFFEDIEVKMQNHSSRL